MSANRAPLSGSDTAILRLVGFLGLATVDQVLRVLYQPSSRSYVQKRLKHLVSDDDPYLIRDRVPDRIVGGSTPYVYTLSTRGARLVRELGLDVPLRKRPSEQRGRSFEHIQHQLDTNDVQIAVSNQIKMLPGGLGEPMVPSNRNVTERMAISSFPISPRPTDWAGTCSTDQ